MWTLVLATLIFVPAGADAALCWSKYNAVTYAENYALTHNSSWPYFSGANCTNYVSQCLKAGGIAMDTNHTDRSNWYMVRNINNAWIWGYPWTVAQDFYTYFGTDSRFVDHRYFIKAYDWNSSTTFPTPPNDNPLTNTADFVSSDFDTRSSPNNQHTTIIVAWGSCAYYSGYRGDLIDGNSTDRKHLIWHAKPAIPAADLPYSLVRTWGLDADAN